MTEGTEDFIFQLHRDFNHRTRGKTTASLQSTVGNYFLNVDLCASILAANNWEDATSLQMHRLRKALEDGSLALRTEIARRAAVRALVDEIEDILRANGAKKVPQHHIIELLTAWILHERNDPAHDAMIFLMRSCSSPDERYGPETMYNEMFPKKMLRDHVLPKDVGAVVVHGGVEKRLISLVNSWRGTLVADNGEEEQEELSVLRLATPVVEVIDVLIPSPELEQRGSSTALYIRVLKWCKDDPSKANAATQLITSCVRKHREQFHTALLEQPIGDSQLHHQVSSTTSVCEIGGEAVDVVELVCGSIRCPMLFRAWAKMRSLFDANRSVKATDDEEDITREFQLRLLTVLIRYASLSGAVVQNADQTAGFHAAVPPPIYACMREKLSTVVEGFASPMNSTSTRFCSLFPDCDSYFGSLGSFFELSMERHFPNGVSLSCNPPYSVIVMLRVAEQLTRMFNDAEKLKIPFQVFVVVCNWETTGGSGKKILDQLIAHTRCVRHVSIEPSKAPFQDGHAFVLNRPFFTLGSNTEAFLFQNEIAHTRWPENRTENFDFVIRSWTSLAVTESLKRQRDE